MKAFTRRLVPATLVLFALVGGISASASAQGAHGRRMVRHAAMGTRILCNDGMWGYANRGGCANHDGVAVRQPVYTTNMGTPHASARARARANSHSAVAKGTYSNTIRLHATAKCNDGTYWHSTRRRGACDAHGGVATWF